ncbi:hypothetical protein [uncultured Polaribacter sp.]|uniref:hypothetical protein n=1 Tax=uncultured Polaribacter sp. TaxID=174711 RepID=UPI0030DCC554|tara:strand:+ start:291 stop:764 length:474 start_codon:yes stop_codon:yes gene_type:complete
MKKLILLGIAFFFMHSTFSQERFIKITNQISKKEIIIKENKRIRVKTIDGNKFSGRFKIVNNGTILIDDQEIDLENIEKIKRDALLVSVFTNGFLVYIGTGVAITGVFIAIFTSNPAATLLIIPGAGLVYGGFKSPNFLKGFKKTSDWSYELITIAK